VVCRNWIANSNRENPTGIIVSKRAPPLNRIALFELKELHPNPDRQRVEFFKRIPSPTFRLWKSGDDMPLIFDSAETSEIRPSN
jgi:hypothetical protein